VFGISNTLQDNIEFYQDHYVLVSKTNSFLTLEQLKSKKVGILKDSMVYVGDHLDDSPTFIGFDSRKELLEAFEKKEEIEVKNNAESLVYNSEKTLADLGDKISGEEKAKVEAEIESTKKALETNNTEKIKEATEKLTKVFYEMSEQLYKNANPNAAQGAADPNGATAEGPKTDENGNVYDADYKVEE